MSSLKDYSQGRMDGMDLALRIVKTDGIDGLEKEIQVRGRTRINTALCCKELDIAAYQLKNLCMETFTILLIDTLHVHLGFGEKRVKDFMDKFWLKADSLMAGYATWQDYVDAIREELGYDLQLPVMVEEGMLAKAEDKRERKRAKQLSIQSRLKELKSCG